MEVLLLRTWIKNIGNGFIDKGAKRIIGRTGIDTKIIESSGYPDLIAEQKALGEFSGLTGSMGSLGEKVAGYRRKRSTLSDRMVNVSQYVDVDVAVLPGCILYQHGIGTYLPTLKELSDREIPILLLGAGGGDYEQGTVNRTLEIIDGLNIQGIITRDEKAFEKYSHITSQNHNGIDCAFFIDEWHDPAETRSDFDMATFDSVPEPDIHDGREIVRADHNPFEQPHRGLLKQRKARWDQKEFYNSENIFMSDTIEDYLFFYANATVTHSDRIHACAPTLAYGNKAQFHYETPRAKLFDRVLDECITDKPVSLDRDRLEEQKKHQVAALESMLEEV